MKTKISNFVNEVIQSHHLVGVAVGVVRESHPYLEAGFGVRSLESRDAVTPDSLFHLASISKLFVATAVMQLVEQGKIALEDPLEKHLPYLKIKNPFGRHLTIQHMLSHTSGFPDISDYHWDAPEEDDEALERYVRSLDGELLFNPGERFFYSNMAYEVLGYLVAKISKKPFEEYVKANILVRLDMSSSTHFRKNVPPDLAVVPHVIDLTTHVSDIYPYNRAHAPSSTLHSNVREMNRWATANINRGILSAITILHPSTYDEMWKPHSAVGKPDRPGKSAGLGWFIDRRQGYKIVYHSGHDVGFSTFFLLVPERSIGITVLCNTAPAPAEEIAFGILDILLGVEPDPLKPSVMLQLGEVYAEKGLVAMQAHLEGLIDKHSHEFDFGIGGFLGVSSALLDGNQNVQAIEILTFALQLFPNSAAGHELLARAFFQAGNFEEALLCAQRSLMIEPGNAFLRQQIKPLLGEG